MSSSDHSSSGYESETSHNSTTSNITDDEIMQRLYGKHPQSQKDSNEVKSADEYDVQQLLKHGIMIKKDNLFNGIHLPESMLPSTQRQKGQYFESNMFKQNGIVASPPHSFRPYNQFPHSLYYNFQPIQYGYGHYHTNEIQQCHHVYQEEWTIWQHKTFYNSRESQNNDYSVQKPYYQYSSQC